jgi:suppressor for copper-sensitivity B
MQADWTRSDPAISRYLESHDRFGIPFNIVYGPNAPDGIILSEVLSTAAVMAVLDEAALR